MLVFPTESNWGSPGCLCHHMTYTTRPKSHIQEQQIWKYKLDLTSSCQSPCNWNLQGFSSKIFNEWIIFQEQLWTSLKISNTFSNSGNLYQSILRGADQFAHIFKSWNSILKNLFNYEYLYIYIYYVPTLTLHCTKTKMSQDMYIASKRIYTNGPTIIYNNIIPYSW